MNSYFNYLNVKYINDFGKISLIPYNNTNYINIKLFFIIYELIYWIIKYIYNKNILYIDLIYIIFVFKDNIDILDII